MYLAWPLPNIPLALQRYQPRPARLHKSQPKRYIRQAHVKPIRMCMKQRNTSCCIGQSMPNRRRKRLRSNQLLHGSQRNALHGVEHGQRPINRQAFTHGRGKGCDSQLCAD